MKVRGEAGARLVVVTGPPGAGKTTLARALARRLALPLICKDDLKEILFDGLGWGDRAHSRRLSDVSYELMYHVAAAELAAGGALILEANFRPEAAQRLRELVGADPSRVVQILVSAERRILVDRLARRADDGLRHPGHLDAETLPEAGAMIDAARRLKLGGTLIEVDTTEPAEVDPEALAVRLEELGLAGGLKGKTWF